MLDIQLRIMLFSFIVQVFCLIDLGATQSFLWENKPIGNDYMDPMNYKLNNKDGADVLKENGIPNRVAVRGIDALTAFKDYKTMQMRILKTFNDEEEKRQLQRNMSAKLPKKCRTNDVCHKMRECIKCSKFWKAEMKQRHTKQHQHSMS